MPRRATKKVDIGSVKNDAQSYNLKISDEDDLGKEADAKKAKIKRLLDKYNPPATRVKRCREQIPGSNSEPSSKKATTIVHGKLPNNNEDKEVQGKLTQINKMKIKRGKGEEIICECDVCPQFEKINEIKLLLVSCTDQNSNFIIRLKKILNPGNTEFLGAREYVEEEEDTVKPEPDDNQDPLPIKMLSLLVMQTPEHCKYSERNELYHIKSQGKFSITALLKGLHSNDPERHFGLLMFLRRTNKLYSHIPIDQVCPAHQQGIHFNPINPLSESHKFTTVSTGECSVAQLYDLGKVQSPEAKITLNLSFPCEDSCVRDSSRRDVRNEKAIEKARDSELVVKLVIINRDGSTKYPAEMCLPVCG